MPSIFHAASSDVVRRIETPEIAPDFVLPDEKGNEWRLSDQIGRVTAILFYPQNETMVCRRQLCSLRDNWAEYLNTRAEIVGVSPATSGDHLKFSSKYKLPLRLLADQDRQVTRKFAKHPIFPLSFTRAIVVVDAKGFVRTRKIMLRAFRPSDRSVITAIHAARADALTESYATITARARSSEIES